MAAVDTCRSHHSNPTAVRVAPCPLPPPSVSAAGALLALPGNMRALSAVAWSGILGARETSQENLHGGRMSAKFCLLETFEALNPHLAFACDCHSHWICFDRGPFASH